MELVRGITRGSVSGLEEWNRVWAVNYAVRGGSRMDCIWEI